MRPQKPFPKEADPRLAGSFRNFLTKTWRSLGFGDPTPIQMDAAHYLQYGGKRIILMGFRGMAKSYITVPYSLWNLYRDPYDFKVLTTSATGGFAETNAAFAFMMLNNFDWLDWLKPRPHQRQSMLEFDVNYANPAKDASFSAVGIFGQLTGRRADLIVPDDVETPNTSSTPKEREELRKRVGEFGAIIKAGGQIAYLGTAQHEDTLYLDREKKGYTLRLYPILYPSQEEMKKYGNRLAPSLKDAVEANPHLAGTSTDPTRFDEADIEQRRLEFGSVEFDRQYRLFLDAGAENQKPLKLRDLVCLDITPPPERKRKEEEQKLPQLPDTVVWSSDPQHRLEDIPVDSQADDGNLYGPRVADHWGPADFVLMWVDPSGDGSDETTWTVVALKGSRPFLLEQGHSLEGSSATTLRSVAQTAKKWGVQEIYVESNFGQAMFGELLRPVLREKSIDHPCTITPVTQGRTQKEVRIVNTLEPVMTSHRLVVNTQVLRDDLHIPYQSVADGRRRFYRLTYQITRLSKLRDCLAQDDRVDGLAGAVAQCLGRLQATDEDRNQERRDEALKKEADAIIEARRKAGLPVMGEEKGNRALAKWVNRKKGAEGSSIMGGFRGNNRK